MIKRFHRITDREWEKYGEKEPYFAVLTQEKFRTTVLNTKSRIEFFNSGERYINRTFEIIGNKIDPEFIAKRAIDFGCGVGRTLIPLARYAEKVIGIDVSDSMMDIAKKNCEEHHILNAEFIKSDDTLSQLKGKFNFIHSFIVFQHISKKRGERLLKNLLAHLDEGGVCVLHFTFKQDIIKFNLKSTIICKMPFVRNINNVIKGRDFYTPFMEMHLYDMNKMLYILQKMGIERVHVEFTDEYGFLGVLLFFQYNRTHNNQLEAGLSSL